MESRSRPTPRPRKRPRWIRLALAIVSVAIFVFAARILAGEFRSLRPISILAAAHRWHGRFALAFVLAAASFLVVGAVEWRALAWAKARVPLGSAIRASFVANGIAHSLGATALVAGAVRARLYMRYGVGLTTAATVTAFQAATSVLGFATLAGVVALFGQGPEGSAGPAVGVLLIAGVATYLLTCRLARGSLKAFGRSFELPAMKDGLAQVGLGVLDNGLAMAALWVLLPLGAVPFPPFIADYVVAYLAGALSGVPGGIGPFEGLMAKLLPAMDAAGLVAAFLGFRLVFYILPLMLAGALFLIDLVLQRGKSRLSTVQPAAAGRPSLAIRTGSAAATNAE